MSWAWVLGLVVLGYLMGSVPFGFVLAKLRGVDLRRVGSGNIGATNAARALGAWAFPVILLLDAAKAFVPALVGKLLVGPVGAVLGGGAAVLGHVFTPWLGFKGGKGVASILGAFLAISPLGVLVGFGVWLLVLLAFRYVSLASILGVFGGFLWVVLAEGELASSLFAGLAALGVWITHRSNVKRLLAGTEPRFSFKRPKK